MKKKITFIILFLLIFIINSQSVISAEMTTFTVTELQEILKIYSVKYEVRFFHQETNVNYKGKELKQILVSNAIRGRIFENKFPNSYGVNASIAYYLKDLGFKIVKECGNTPGHNRSQIGFTWKKSNKLIHYLLYSIYEHPSVGSDYTIKLISEDICGNDYVGPEKY